MTSSRALIFNEDGSIEATPELKLQLNVTAGTRLELIQQDGSDLLFRIPPPEVEPQSWMSLRGILAHSSADPNAELDQERQRELELDAR
jgi:hypothetical protein